MSSSRTLRIWPDALAGVCFEQTRRNRVRTRTVSESSGRWSRFLRTLTALGASRCAQRPDVMRNLPPPELRWLHVQIRPFLRWHALSFGCFTVGSVLALLQPLGMKWLIDQALPKRNVMQLFCAVALLFLAYEGRALCMGLGAYLTISSTQRMALALRVRLLKHLDTLSAEYHDTIPLGSRSYPFREPIDEIAYFGSELFPSILRTLLATLLTFSAMLALNPRMALAIVPLIPAFLFARHYFRRRLESDADTVQSDRTLLNGFLQEHLAAAVQIQLLRRERRQERTALRLLAKTMKSQRKLSKTGILFSVSTNLAIAIAASAVVGTGSWNVFTGTLTIGGLVAFYSYVAQLFEPLSGAMDMYAKALRTFSSVRQVQMTLSLESTIKNRAGAIPIPNAIPSKLQFQDVCFGYARQNELVHISFLEISAGERLAVVGPNGAGKSTFARLAARLYDPTSGSVRLGGVDLRDLRLDSLRAEICYLPQNPALFDDTFAGNLRLGKPDASEAELSEVIGLVELNALLESLPGRWNERIGPGGSRLSGGERQRLALARTLLQRPRILILDEATSSLDPTGEQLILPRIDRLFPDATLMFLSHRLLSLTWVDRILVFEAGRIVQDGAHCLLQTQRGPYVELLRASDYSRSLSIP
jgi:ABC-type multidrug transport system fused ATPase/permease subunit